jgi:hypothetical protein
MKLNNGLQETTTMAMTSNDVYHLLNAADITLAFDTSVTVRHGFLFLCDLANRVNARRAMFDFVGRIRLCVPAAAHAERLFDLAQEHGTAYNVELVRGVLHERQVEILDFTVDDAEHCAELLVQRYGTPAEWHAFKKRRCLECAGLPAKYHDLAKGTGKKCGASNDWLIIAQASRQDMLLVMDDKGRHGEFNLIQHQARYSDVRTALERILGELADQFSTA